MGFEPKSAAIHEVGLNDLGMAIEYGMQAPDWILTDANTERQKQRLGEFYAGIANIMEQQDRSESELSYVQTLVAKRNLQLDGLRYLAINRTTDGVTAKLRREMDAQQEKIQLINAKLAGINHAFTKKNVDYRAIGIVEQALAGDELRWPNHKDEFRLPNDPGKPMNELIIGAVILLWTEVNGQKLIYIQQERHTKPQFDKQEGDFSLVAETRKRGETIRQSTDRGLYEETSLKAEDVLARNPIPIGYFQFLPDKSKGEIEGPWIVAFSGYLPTKEGKDPVIGTILDEEELVTMSEVGPRDGETFNPGWGKPEIFMTKLAVRGAMLGIVDAWLTGKTRIIQPTSPGRR